MTIEKDDLFANTPGWKRGVPVDKDEYLKGVGEDTLSWLMGENPKLKPKPQEEGVFYKSSFAFSKTKLEQKLLGFKPTDPPTQGMLIGRAVDITFRTMIILKEVPELFGLRLLDVDKILTETFNISEKKAKETAMFINELKRQGYPQASWEEVFNLAVKVNGAEISQNNLLNSTLVHSPSRELNNVKEAGRLLFDFLDSLSKPNLKLGETGIDFEFNKKISRIWKFKSFLTPDFMFFTTDKKIYGLEVRYSSPQKEVWDDKYKYIAALLVSAMRGITYVQPGKSDSNRLPSNFKKFREAEMGYLFIKEPRLSFVREGIEEVGLVNFEEEVIKPMAKIEKLSF